MLGAGHYRGGVGAGGPRQQHRHPLDPAHRGVGENKIAGGMAKEAAGGQSHGVPDQIRWQASLPHLSRRATERRSEATS